MTKRETILARVEAALAGTAGVSTRIYRDRVAAFARAETPALVIEPVSDEADQLAVGRLSWNLVFQVLVIVRAEEASSASDSIVQEVHNRIISDATLDAMATSLLPTRTDWTFHDADQPLGIISMQFSIGYHTSNEEIT